MKNQIETSNYIITFTIIADEIYLKLENKHAPLTQKLLFDRENSFVLAYLFMEICRQSHPQGRDGK